MKKLINKLTRKKKSAVAPQSTPSGLRITNETVAEHRERILAGGRKFKYPLQYPKYRIVIMTILIVVSLIGALSVIVIWQLYGAQNTSKFMQRITQVIPVPAASVDGQTTRYSDYLLELRSALHYLTTKEAVNFSSDDGRRQLDYQKRLALNKAIGNAYAQKLAAQRGITVTTAELNDFIKQEIHNNHLGVTEDVYRKVIQDYYDWTFEDYQDSVRRQLLRKKVVAAVDIEGREKIDTLLQQLQKSANFEELATRHSEDSISKTNGGKVGFVSKDTDDPNGLIKAASALKPNQVSGVVEGADGFYIVKLLEARQADISFAKIFVTYKTFNKQLEALKKEGKIIEYIKVPDSIESTNQ